MPAYSGKYLYTDASGGTIDQGPCQLSFEAGACIVTPAGGTPLAFDLGDADRAAPAEWDFQLALYTGRTVVLKQFGAAFGRMSEELLAAWRDRTVQCLLLEDLEEIARYQGAANGAPAEIRIFKSNLAVLPLAGTPIQWRLAEIDSCAFDQTAYAIVLQSAGERLVLSKLGKKTDEAFGNLRQAIDALHTKAAAALHDLFPFLNADALRQLQQAMPEGRSCPIPALAAIHPKLPDALQARTVDESLAPYFEPLARQSTGPLFAGFKFTWGSGEAPDSADEEAAPRPETEPEAPLFFWYFFPLARNMAGWEATTGTGRATYFFRADPPIEPAVARLTRGLALVNFRREPIYLPDASLEQQPRFQRYATAARKLPDLRALRAAYLGRAIHSSPETWLTQVLSITGQP
ncbi:MAG: hypothetical protein ABSC05_12225 [Candidatus Solibacter sp.]|jgi:hypothetical protein